jgi:hypothetical protein
MKTKTITQTGIVIKGTAMLNLWGGGSGSIKMESYYLPLEHITKDNILRCVNDGSFGCESIEDAEIDIFIKYDNGSVELDRTIFAYHPIHTQLFSGWQELRNQGIEC